VRCEVGFTWRVGVQWQKDAVEWRGGMDRGVFDSGDEGGVSWRDRHGGRATGEVRGELGGVGEGVTRVRIEGLKGIEW